MNANLKSACPCGPNCACNPCLCTGSSCGHAPEEIEAEGPACFCGTDCSCDS